MAAVAMLLAFFGLAALPLTYLLHFCFEVSCKLHSLPCFNQSIYLFSVLGAWFASEFVFMLVLVLVPVLVTI